MKKNETLIEWLIDLSIDWSNDIFLSPAQKYCIHIFMSQFSVKYCSILPDAQHFNVWPLDSAGCLSCYNCCDEGLLVCFWFCDFFWFFWLSGRRDHISTIFDEKPWILKICPYTDKSKLINSYGQDLYDIIC